MCGVAGFFHYGEPERPVDRALLTRITRRLAHRGPDDEGFHVDGPMGLGHRRLSILELSAAGHQPMTTASRRFWISYNGELYNHAELRPRLEARGHVFSSRSDTETLLCLLESEGPDALADTLGIFAFACWDARERRLLLARDALGVKQLYYHDDGKSVVFASEIKALLEWPGLPRRLDPDALNQYLAFHTPLFERTFLKDVRQLLPGEALEFGAGGRRSRVFFRVDDFTPRGGQPEENVRELREQLSVVVRDQLMSDVPVGVFFSGGIDSTAVAAYAARAGQPPRCFGVHFDHPGVIDERPYQEAAARALGLELELITLDGSTFPDDLVRLVEQQDQPVIGSAMIPMFYVSKLAARRVKVCLGGQAGDEVFGGYARYALVHPLEVLRSWRGPQGAAPAAANGASARVGGSLWKQLRSLRNLGRLARTLGRLDWRDRYFENFAKVPEARWREALTPDLVARASCRQVFRDTLARSKATDPADAVMHWDMQTYLTGLFQQDDRMSMANSLESRVPLADPRLVRFAFRTGFPLKFASGTTKWILRQAVADAVPAEILNRRKAGFDNPSEAWMRGPHRGFVRELLLSRKARDRGLWNAPGLSRLLEDDGSPHWFDVVWKAACIEAWACAFLDATPAASEQRAAAS